MKENADIRTWFRLTRMPFSQQLKPSELYMRQSMLDMASKVRFAIDSGLCFMVIGDVGSGKSSTLDYMAGGLDSKRYEPVRIIAGAWGFTELLRQVMSSLNIVTRTSQQATMLRQISEAYVSIRESGKTPVLFIDEAGLLSSEVFQQLHLLCNQSMTSSGRQTPIVMCGQDILFEKAASPFSKPLMSRVMDGHRLSGMSIPETSEYIGHHICTLAGGRRDIFDDNALIAVHQSSAGIPRQINEICLKAMSIAMQHEQTQITPDMVRKATSKWWEA